MAEGLPAPIVALVGTAGALAAAAAKREAATPRVAVVIPCYRVADHASRVIAAIGPQVHAIYVVDDACPEGSGTRVRTTCADPRVRVLVHPRNQGVGGAVLTGYRQAIADSADIIVKIDGDGQMDPALIPLFVAPITAAQADYTKGNRFYHPDGLRAMPAVRLMGNAMLSLVAKLSTGYWNLFDVTNGYTAVHARVLRRLQLDKLSARYFFETDMLFRLNIIRAVVIDIPMDAVYAGEPSGLRIGRVAGEFALKNLRNFGKRIAYNYFVRDMTVASLELVAGALLLGFGAIYGGWNWWENLGTGQATPTGTIMLSVLCMLVGLQMLLAFVAYDVASVPRRPIHPDLLDRSKPGVVRGRSDAAERIGGAARRDSAPR
jgi:glycosyltransferase involved in cell wall biosynthesis